MDYKKGIISIIESIDDCDFLEFVYGFVKRLKENWGF